MFQRENDSKPDYELILDNLLHSLQGTGQVICGKCRTVSPVWETMLQSGQFYCPGCIGGQQQRDWSRSEERWTLTVPFRFRLGEQTGFGFTRDLSPGGLGLCHSRIKPEEGAAPEITLFGPRLLNVTGTVRYSRSLGSDNQFGVELVGHAFENEAKVRAVCAYFRHKVRGGSGPDLPSTH